MPYLEMPLPHIPEDNKDKEHPLKPIPYEVDADSISILSDDTYDAFLNNNAKILGEGAECLVVSLPDKPDKAIAYSFHNTYEAMDVVRAKNTFYAHKILKILFPNNFPTIHAAFAQDNNGNKGTIRERIEHSPYDGRVIKNKFKQVDEFFAYVLRVSPYQFFDANDDNFVLSNDGNEYFVDLVNTADLQGNSLVKVLSDKEAQIVDYMSKHGFPDDDIIKVSTYIGRMEQIANLSL